MKDLVTHVYEQPTMVFIGEVLVEKHRLTLEQQHSSYCNVRVLYLCLIARYS